MPTIYWFSDGVGVDVDQGGPDGNTPIATMMIRWIRSQRADLIVYGGDVYGSGTPEEFDEFFAQMDNNVALICAAPGNHDWEDAGEVPLKGRIPRGYEAFWSSHPESRQPIADTQQGAARYDHFIDLSGWRLIFIDTGEYQRNPWPGEPGRSAWLRRTLKPGRANILFAHHSRISCGLHGHNSKLDDLWDALFDQSGPRVAFCVAGHDHNVNSYGPRSRSDPEGRSVPFAEGIHVFVNGAGGDGHYHCGSGIASFLPGKKGDLFSDDDNYCVTRVSLIDERSAAVEVISFGTKATRPPVVIAESLVSINL